ncbi:hypothetical protein L226DRAFT_570005 [Lentinus tigrinus ALCF2SS1-7]|uniref:Uncharacterized protein n=1 Tax=Lentinus tigrinus ALCF2SS1-6 TaxID=1328759 RepID=A0A5C2S9Z1_9APHY|nr:hypothetical protein L227DRAFT_611052 [Lentinus tigrinus ALCF2SS1-6]RPD75754.1 hypothetical protein L226DRAFT_570005 [Lentinus tigrinus ALCF2SS1-7]
MPTLVLRTLILTLSFSSVWAATTTLPVDDSDSRILYTGTWTKNPINDPKNFNYGGSLTATNDTTAKATFTFSGAVQVAVYGAFPYAGTVSMRSQYRVDNTAWTPFEPPTVIKNAGYRLRFFLSDILSTGTHELFIENMGNSFYLDYILLVVPTSSTLSPSPTPPRSSAISVTAQTSSPVSAGTTVIVSTSTAIAPQQQTNTTSQAVQPSSSTASVTSSGALGVPSTLISSSVTSMFVAPVSTSSSMNTTQTETSGVVSTGTSQRSGAIALPVGVYVAIGVGSFTALVVLVAGVWFLRRRRRSRSLADEVTPFDPGLTSIASEKSQLSQGPYARVNRASSTASTIYHSAPPYTPVHETRDGYETQNIDTTSRASLEGVGEGHSEMAATYEPLASPSAMSPLVTGRVTGTHRDKLSPVTSSPTSPGSKSRRARHDTLEFRRRSVDGGVRLAGGPSGTRRDADLTDLDARSAVSTLPPLYQSYPAGQF